MVMAVCVVLYVNENCGPIKIFIPPMDRMLDIIDAANSKMHCMVQPMNILIRDYGTMKWMDEDGLHYNKCDKKDPEIEKQIRGMRWDALRASHLIPSRVQRVNSCVMHCVAFVLLMIVCNLSAKSNGNVIMYYFYTNEKCD
jgi:hypothetical protein